MTISQFTAKVNTLEILNESAQQRSIYIPDTGLDIFSTKILRNENSKAYLIFEAIEFIIYIILNLS